MFYLDVRAKDQVRSVALNESIFKHLQARFQELRDVKAESMSQELTKTVRLAKADLDKATSALQAAERRVGADLGELRSMRDLATSDTPCGAAARKSAPNSADAAARQGFQALLAAIVEAKADPSRLAAMPNRLLDSHSALRRLKDGLVDAQLHTALLLGTMSLDHPKVQAAKETEEAIGRDLRELTAAQGGIEIELRLCAERRTLLEDQLARTNWRLSTLSDMRAEYANLCVGARNRATLLDRAEQNLAEARAAQPAPRARASLAASTPPTPASGRRSQPDRHRALRNPRRVVDRPGRGLSGHAGRHVFRRRREARERSGRRSPPRPHRTTDRR